MLNLQNKGVQHYFKYLTLQNQYCKLYLLENIIPMFFCIYNEDTCKMNYANIYTEIQGNQQF